MSTLRVVTKAVGQPPEDCRVGDDLPALQRLVGGYIEAVHLFPDEANLLLVVNEEGKREGLAPHLSFPADVVLGNVFVTRRDPDSFDFVDVTDADVARIVPMLQERDLSR